MPAQDRDHGGAPAPGRRRADRYEPADFFLVRAPLLPATTVEQLTGPDAAVSDLVRQPLVATAIAAASPVLYRQVTGDSAATPPTGRLAASLFRYLNRMCTRPTPYGLFAGVGFGRFAPSTSLELARHPVGAVECRADLGWLSWVVDTAVQAMGLDLDRAVFASQAILDRGGRLNIYGRADAAADDTDVLLSVKASQFVRDALALAEMPIRLGDLVELLGERYAAADQDQIRYLVSSLLAHGFLLDSLSAAGGIADRCGYIADRLPGSSEVADVSDGLRAVSDRMQYFNKVAPSELTPADLLAIEEAQSALVTEGSDATVQVDSALTMAGVELNRSVGLAVADAVTAIAALTEDASNRQHLASYATEFNERYGSGAEVPILELLDPHWGLDAPPTYLRPKRFFPLSRGGAPGQPNIRQDILLSWIQEAVVDGGPVELTDERVAQLSLGSSDARHYPLVDVFVQVHAASRSAIDRGEWLAVLGPMGVVPGGRSFGRFGSLLGPDAEQALHRHVSSERSHDDGPIYAELTYRPFQDRMNNVSNNPHWRDYEIPVNIAPSVEPDKVIALRDLVVGTRDGEFYVRSRRLDREVVARQSHMLTPLSAPNVCRFLLDIAAQRDGGLPRLNERVLETLPFCPRFVRGRVVVSPACWNLTHSTLRPWTPRSRESFVSAARAWRERMRVPRHVYLCNRDQRILLDLDDHQSLRELERVVRKLDPNPASPLHYQKLQECLPGLDGTWLRDELGRPYFSELVVPLALRARKGARRPALPRTAVRGTSRTGRGQLPPGGPWAYLKLFSAADRHDPIIVSFSRFAGELEAHRLTDKWFFMRYADPMPHVRVRVHSSDTANRRDVLAALIDWAGSLITEHLVSEFSIDTYRQETARYGGEHSIDLAEQIFCGDSAGVGSVIFGLRSGSMATARPVATAFTLDRLLSSLGFDDAAKLRLNCLAQTPFRSTVEFRARRTDLLRMLRSAPDATPDPDAAHLRALYRVGEEQRWRSAADVVALGAADELVRPWPLIVESLAHMHVNRMLGIDRSAEKEVYALLRGAVRSVVSRASGTGHQELGEVAEV